MAQLFVTELDDAAEERLRARARRHGRTLEAEARAILEAAAREEPLPPGLGEEDVPTLRPGEKGFGDLMYERFKDIGLTENEVRRLTLGFVRSLAGCEARGAVTQLPAASTAFA